MAMKVPADCRNYSSPCAIYGLVKADAIEESYDTSNNGTIEN